jgi:hypothetical protein
MTTHTAAELEPPHPPLARDHHGNLLALPDGTSAWRICRQTTGRPREIFGHDKQPIRFPLEITCDELVAMCGRDSYRVYALDDFGKQLDYVTTWDLTGETRELRNATSASPEPMLPALRPSTALGPVSDLRFALEAMTQMMRTNSDALRSVAESHVDLAKAIVAAKGLPRNARFVLPIERDVAAGEHADDRSDDDAVEEAVAKSWVDLALPFAQKLAEVVPGLVMGKAMQGAPARNANRSLGATSGDDSAMANAPSKPAWELRDVFDWSRAARKREEGVSSEEASEPQPMPAAEIPASLRARVATDPALVQRLVAIKTQLTEDEARILMTAIAQAPEDAQLRLLDEIKALPDDHAVALCREAVIAMREGVDPAPADNANP